MENTNQYNLVISKIASKLKKLRIEKGFTSYENFAYQYDLSRIQYWRMEKGTNFTIKYLMKILEIHQISLEDFFKDVFEKE
ncbi:MAG: helix-turn-helix transcriptional regulator [Flavobacterium sp.]|nr:helix-turn-helix transcriptional regulator [Flavobacterium sp.]